VKQLLILLLLSLPSAVLAQTVLGVNISTPLVFSGSGGVILGGGDPRLESVPMLEGEIGLGGGKLLFGLDGSGRQVGFGMKASMLWTWLEPVNVDADQAFLGVEFQGNVGKLLGSLGGYYNISGDGDSFIGSLSLGFRF